MFPVSMDLAVVLIPYRLVGIGIFPIGGSQGPPIGKTIISICDDAGNRKWIKFYAKEGLGDLYGSPEGHCPPTPRGGTPNFGVFDPI